MSMAEILRPSRSSMIQDGLIAADRFRGLDRIGQIELRRVPCSIRSSTSAVVPIFKAVAHWLIFASPMIT